MVLAAADTDTSQAFGSRVTLVISTFVIMAVAMLKSDWYLYLGVLYIWINIIYFLNVDDSFCYQRQKSVATWVVWILLGLYLNLGILVD